MRDSDQRQYSKEWLQHERPQPIYDEDVTAFYDSFYKHNPVHTSSLDQIFKKNFVSWLDSSTINDIKGLDTFSRIDIIQGCTQFIDDIYQRRGKNVMVFENDYKYHSRLNPEIIYTTIDTLDQSKELIISMPFPAVGDNHPNMLQILDRCYALNIPVHIDAAWLVCCKNITFDASHPAIKSIGFSLSKAGLGGNRIGIRLSHNAAGAISIMNDFNMTPQALVSMGIEYMAKFKPSHWWDKYGERYDNICADFNLVPTNAIHIALYNNQPVGVRCLLRAKL
jgi:hypothetical protein